MRLFDDGRTEIARRTGLVDLGVIPWFDDAVRLPAEDAAGLDSRTFGLHDKAGPERVRPLRIVVPRLPRIANFDDLDPLAAEADVSLEIVRSGSALPGDADVVLLPGSKATLADLDALRRAGWDIDIAAHRRRGGHVLGLCGGYQMLGRSVADPLGLEGPARTAPALDLLPIETTLDSAKVLRQVAAHDALSGTDIRGYEIHMGRTDGAETARPMLMLDGRPEGAVSADGRVQGCYIHGLFTADRFRRSWLDRVRAARDLGDGATAFSYETAIDTVLDRLAAHIAAAADLDAILEIARAR